MRKRWSFATFVVLCIFIIISLGHLYHVVEGWNYLDSIYFTVVTLTTIGYGDLAPLTDTGKILTIFASFFGIAMVFYLISVIGSYFFERKLRHLGVQMDSKIRPQFHLVKKKRKRKR